MGLITGLLTLPLAPVRGTMWIAERIEEQASLELNDDAALRQQLSEIAAARESGDFDEEELDAAEDELLARLIEIRGYGEGVTLNGVE